MQSDKNTADSAVSSLMNESHVLKEDTLFLCLHKGIIQII